MAEAFQPDPAPPEYPVNGRGRVYQPGLGDDEKTWAVLSHLSLLGHVVLPFAAAAIPWVIWLVKKDRSAYVDDHAGEALNFHITLILYNLLIIPLAVITCGVGAALVVGVYALGVVGMILATLAANRGEFFRYPMTFRFIK